MGETKSYRLSHLVVTGTVCVLLATGIFAALLAFFNPRGSGAPSPIKVRGGAMTVRSVKAWTQASATSWCSDISDLSHLSFKDATAVSSSGSGPIPLAFDKLSTTSWTLTIAGRNSHSASDGVIITPNLTNNCAGSTGLSIVIASTGTYGAFYGNDGVVDVGYAKRFQDTDTADCTGPDGFKDAHGTIATGDEDLCERMSGFTLALQTTVAQTYTYACPNGECTINIGKGN